MRNLIGDEWKISKTGSLEIFNPYTKELIDTVPLASKEDIEEAILYAKRAVTSWKNVSLSRRVRTILDFLRLVKKNKKRLALKLTEETGKKLADSLYELDRLIVIGKDIINEVSSFEEEALPVTDKKLVLNKREAVGIVAAFLSSSEAIIDFAKYVLSSIVMGNAVIVKPSSNAPLTIIELAYLLNKAGSSDGVIQVINGTGVYTGDLLAGSSDIDLIYFSGGTYAGVKVYEKASKNMTRIITSLSTSNPLIVDETANINKVINDLVKSKCLNNGQNANTPRRILIDSAIYDEFLNLLRIKLDDLRIGNPLTDVNISTLITEEAANKVYEDISGNHIIYGGRKSGTTIEPTIIEVERNNPLLSFKEITGPVFVVYKYVNIDDAIEVANNCPYGMAAYIYTSKDPIAFLDLLEVGAVLINTLDFEKEQKIARNSLKYSGTAPLDIKNILKEFSNVKALCLNAFDDE